MENIIYSYIPYRETEIFQAFYLIYSDHYGLYGYSKIF